MYLYSILVAFYARFWRQALPIILLGGAQAVLWSHGLPTLKAVYPSDSSPSLAGACHILLFYGFGDTDIFPFASGNEVLKALTHETRATQIFGESPFVVTRHGIRYLLSSEPLSSRGTGEAHRDQCLATYAALGLSRSTPIMLRGKEYSINDLISESQASFSLEQHEIEWSVLAYTNYLPPLKAWENRFGERITFSAIVEELLGRDLNKHSCGGTHILDALIQIDEADRIHNLLEVGTRKKLVFFINRIIEQIASSQEDDGSFPSRWCSSIQGASPKTLISDLLISGHILEAFSPDKTMRELPPDTSRRALLWIDSTVRSNSYTPTRALICPFTHAVRALRGPSLGAN